MGLRRTIGLARLRDRTIPAEGSMSAARLLCPGVSRFLSRGSEVVGLEVVRNRAMDYEGIG